MHEAEQGTAAAQAPMTGSTDELRPRSGVVVLPLHDLAAEDHEWLRSRGFHDPILGARAWYGLRKELRVGDARKRWRMIYLTAERLKELRSYVENRPAFVRSFADGLRLFGQDEEYLSTMERWLTALQGAPDADARAEAERLLNVARDRIDNLRRNVER